MKEREQTGTTGWKERVQEILLLLIAVSIPFHRNMTTVLILLFGVWGILSGGFRRPHWKPVLPFALFFFVVTLSLFWSSDQETGSFGLVKKLPILAVPLFFAFNQTLAEIQIRRILVVFAGLMGVLWLYAFGSAYLAYSQTGEYKFFFYHELASQVNMSALYFSLFLVFSELILIREFYRPGPGRFHRWGVMVLIFLYGLFVMSLASRASILALGFLFIFTLYHYRKHLRTRWLTFAFLISLVTIVVATVLVPLLNERFKEAINHENRFTLEKVGGGTSFRIAKWNSAIKVAARQIWLGCGEGDVQAELDEQYLEDEHPQILHLNAHNQYLQVLLGQGLLGLGAFLFCLFQPFRKQYRSFLSIGFTLIFSVCILTEAMLEVQKGVVFFSFFSSLFLFSRDKDH